MLTLWGCAPLNIQSSHRTKNNPAKKNKKKRSPLELKFLLQDIIMNFCSIKVAGFEKNSCPNHIAEPDQHTPLQNYWSAPK